jgi:hypothetical protein
MGILASRYAAFDPAPQTGSLGETRSHPYNEKKAQRAHRRQPNYEDRSPQQGENGSEPPHGKAG